MTDIFEINSFDRRQGTPNNFSVLLPTTIKKKSNFELVSASIPLNIYNVTSQNNTICYFEYSTVKNATVTPGYYTTTALCTALAASMTLVGPDTYTVTYNNTTKLTTISKISTFSLFLDSRSPILELLGFILDGTTTATAISAVSSLAPSLYPEKIYINIQELGTAEVQSTGNKSYTFYVPVITSDSTYNSVGPEILGKQKISISQLNTGVFTVQLVDKKMAPIQLFSNWSFILAVS